LDDVTLTAEAYSLTKAIADHLPQIRAQLASDLRAAYQGDPAATSISEILLCYPGMTAIIHYRLAHALYSLGARQLAKAHLIIGIQKKRRSCWRSTWGRLTTRTDGSCCRGPWRDAPGGVRRPGPGAGHLLPSSP